MTGDDRTLSITGRFRNLMGAELNRARRELAEYIEEARLGAVPFRELSRAAREMGRTAADMPRLDIDAALGVNVARQSQAGYESLATYARGFDEVRRSAREANQAVADMPKLDIDAALRGRSTETVRQVDRVRAALRGLAAPIADLAKPFAEPIAKVKQFGRETADTLRFLARPVTAPIGWLRGALDQIVTVRAALVGFLAVAGARAAISSITETVRQTAEVGRIAQSVGASAESVSALRFALQSVGVEGGRVVSTFNQIEKAVAQAVGGNRGKIVAFRDLGIDVQELKRLEPEELLARIAKGLEKFDTRTRGVALQPLFEDSFREFLPLLGRGEEAFRRMVAEAREFGGLVTADEARQALEVERAFQRIRTAVEALKRAAILDIAAEWAPGLEQMARMLVQNRDLVKELAHAIGSGIAAAIDVASRAIIGLVRLIDDIPFVDLIDEKQLGRQVADLKRQLTELQFGPILELESRKSGVGGAPRPEDGQRLEQLRKRERELIAEIGGLERTLQNGLAGVLEASRQRIIDAVADARKAIDETSKKPAPEPPPPPAPRRKEDLPGFELRFELTKERDLLRFRQQLEQLKPQTAAVREELARIGAELQRNAALAGDWGETLGDAEIKQAIDAIDVGLGRTRETLRLAAEQDTAKFRQELLGLSPATREAKRELIELQRVAETLQVRQQVQTGERSADQARQLERALRERASRERLALDLGDTRQIVQFRQELLQLAPATEGAQRALAGLQAQAKLLDLATSLNEGSLTLEQFTDRAAAAFQALSRESRQIGETFKRSRNDAQQFLLGLEVQTPEVRKEVAGLRAELQRLDLDKLQREGNISPKQYTRGIAALEDSVRRTAQVIDIDAVEATLNWKRELAELGGTGVETAGQIAEIDAQLAEVRARRARAEGGADADLVAKKEQAERERALKEARRYTTAGIWDGFIEGSKAAIQAWQDFSAWGQRAVGTVDSALTDALNTFTDIQLGLADSDAWKEWGRNALRAIQRVINELIVMLILESLSSLIGGSKTPASTPSSYSAGTGLNIPPPPASGIGSATGAGGGGGLLGLGGGRKRLGGGLGGFGPSAYGGGGGGELGLLGGGGPTTIIEHHVHFDVTSADSQDVRRMLTREREHLARLQADSLERTLASRDAVKRVRR